MREYLTELKIEDYGIIKNLEVKDLSDINVLTGRSCVGKTTVLDYIYSNYENNIYMTSRPRLVVNILDYNIIKKFFKENKTDILELLKIINENINDCEIFPKYKDICLHENGKKIYYKNCGNTIETIIEVLIKIANAQHKILLIDDINFNARLSKKVFKILFDLCIKYEVQLFITTHNSELIDGMLECDNEYDMKLFTLFNNNNKTIVRVLDRHKAYELRENHDMDLR